MKRRIRLSATPVFSLIAGAAIAVGLILTFARGESLSGTLLLVMASLPVGAALIDWLRLTLRAAKRPPRSVDDLAEDQPLDEEDIRLWVQQRADELSARERWLNDRALSLQHVLQFPDAIDLVHHESPQPDVGPDQDLPKHDPMAVHDEVLFDLVETKTHELFDKLKSDFYRKEIEDGSKAIHTEAVWKDLRQLVADVAVIYRPDESDPLLSTNIEAISRAIGRVSLRLLVTLENLPGGIHQYDFQTIYNLIRKAVKTYGMYQSAKPYLDVASNLYVAGRLISSTNPLTLVAWWAASKATTYGASKIGQHWVDQQAVGMVRQIIEIIAIEVASLYSPMVRYRDVNWIYAVELVNLASELSVNEFARAEAIREISSLRLPDEYARVSLLRHLVNGKTSHPGKYAPAEVIAVADRMRIAERLEKFLIGHVVTKNANPTAKKKLDQWQKAASDRLDIQFRAGELGSSEEEQRKSCVWSLASFMLEHAELEPEDLTSELETTVVWQSVEEANRLKWKSELIDDPPFLYRWPMVSPDSTLCKQFLMDLVIVASQSMSPNGDSATFPIGESILLAPPRGTDVISVTAYYLRGDAQALIGTFQQELAARLLADCLQTPTPSPSPDALAALCMLFRGEAIHGLYGDVSFEGIDSEGENLIAMIGDSLWGFTIQSSDDAPHPVMTVIFRCPLSDVKHEKVSGYIRNECRLIVGSEKRLSCTIAGSMLRTYDVYFEVLVDRIGK